MTGNASSVWGLFEVFGTEVLEFAKKKVGPEKIPSARVMFSLKLRPAIGIQVQVLQVLNHAIGDSNQVRA